MGKILRTPPKSEFLEVIGNGYYFMLVKDNHILAAFQLSQKSKYWDDNGRDTYYIYKLVTRVGSREIGNLIFEIAKDIAKNNNKKYLRLDCLSTNKKLNEIYEKHNFKLIKTGYENHYPYALREMVIDE